MNLTITVQTCSFMYSTCRILSTTPKYKFILLLLINTICVSVCVWWKYTLTDKLNSKHSMWFVFSSSAVQKTFLLIIYHCMEWDVTVWYVEYTATVLSVVSPLVDVSDVHSTRVASHQTNQDKLVIYTQCIMLWTVEFYCFNTFWYKYIIHIYITKWTKKFAL